MNFAAVMKAPVVFIVIDNGWAISVPSASQTAAKSYGTKAKAYGMPGFDVDGNDVVAVFDTISEAAEHARSQQGPMLVNLRSYRMLGHSSSDDPSRYRDQKEVDYWDHRDPLPRLQRFLSKKGLLSKSQIAELSAELTSAISEAVDHAESTENPPLESLVEDVFATPPRHLTKQVVEALRIIDEQGEADHLQGKFPL
jgi:TPP-dependent pyruvate/acetoin dehydrogenase alpha subunit